jgi:hypothetical protein
MVKELSFMVRHDIRKYFRPALPLGDAVVIHDEAKIGAGSHLANEMVIR